MGKIKKYFITGTDTNIGKTYFSTILLNQFKKQGLETLGIKLISSGAEETKRLLVNQDAILLQTNSTVKVPYHITNPFCFKLPIAPNIAAKKVNCKLNSEVLLNHYHSVIRNYLADVFIFEGAGGWDVPINYNQTLGDVIAQTDLKVIIVVGIKLGCLNHAILTYKSIANSKVKIKGWIANCLDPNMIYIKENINTLQKLLPIPLLKTLNYNHNLF